MQRLLSQIAVGCIASLVSSGAFAGVIFDQAIELDHTAGASDFDLQNQRADDFQLQLGESTITDIHWWGAYGPGNTVTDPDDFTIRFYADETGAPAINPLAEFAVGNVGRVDTGITVVSFDVYAYSVDIAALSLLADTTYWLSIVNNTAGDLNDNWFWSSLLVGGDSNFRTLDGQAWITTDLHLGFQLTNDAVTVPEPSSLALFGTGLAGLGALGWRRRKLRQNDGASL